MKHRDTPRLIPVMRFTILVPIMFCMASGSGQSHMNASEKNLRDAIDIAYNGSSVDLLDRMSFGQYRPGNDPSRWDKYQTELAGWFLDLFEEDREFFMKFLWFVTQNSRVQPRTMIIVKNASGEIPEVRLLPIERVGSLTKCEVSIPMCTSKEDLKAKLMQVFH